MVFVGRWVGEGEEQVKWGGGPWRGKEERGLILSNDG